MCKYKDNIQYDFNNINISNNTGVETCVCCGKIIPEGRQMCPNCEKSLDDNTILTEVHYGGDYC